MHKLISIFSVILLSTNVLANEGPKPDTARDLIKTCGNIKGIFIPEQLNVFSDPTRKVIDIEFAKNSNEFIGCWRYITGVIDTIVTLQEKDLIPSKNVLSYNKINGNFDEKPNSSICFVKPNFNLRTNIFLLMDILGTQYEKIPEKDRDTPGSAVLMIYNALTSTFPCPQ